MASVAPVQTSELRPVSPSPQAAKSGDPFALLLDTVSAKRADAPEPRRRQEAAEKSPRVQAPEKPDRMQSKQDVRAVQERSRSAAPVNQDAPPEEASAAADKAVVKDADQSQPDDAALNTGSEEGDEIVALPVDVEGSQDSFASESENNADETPEEGEQQAAQIDIETDAGIVMDTSVPEQQAPQAAVTDAAAMPTPVAVAEAVVDVAAKTPAVAAAVNTNATAGKQPNSETPAVADAESAIAGEEAPQSSQPAAKPEETQQAQKPVASNHAEAREAAMADKGDQAVQSAQPAKPDVPAQAKEHASARPLEQVPAPSNIENSAPRQQALPQSMPIMPEPVRALAGSINPVNLRAANDGPNNAVPLNANVIGVEIASRAKDGVRRFDIRLDPAELGRIDVQLEVDAAGKASTRLIVERPETLDLLQRDARNLERALQSAGLQTDEGGLEFSLRDQGQQGFADAGTNGGYERRDDFLASAIEDAEPASPALERYARSVLARGGVDIRI